MKIKRRLITILLPLMLATACSNTPTAEQLAKDEKAYNTSYEKYAENSKVAKIHLTEDGKVKSIDIGNQNLRPPTRKVEKDGLGTTLVKETFQTIRSVAGGNAAMALVAVKGFEAAGDRIYDSNNTHSEANQANTHSEANQANTHEEANQSNQANSHQETHETIGGDKAGEYIDKHSEANQTNESVNDSNNGGNISNQGIAEKEAEIEPSPGT